MNNYVVIVRATDSAGNTSDQTISISVVDIDELAPSITGPSGSEGDAISTKTINENTIEFFYWHALGPFRWVVLGYSLQLKFWSKKGGH